MLLVNSIFPEHRWSRITLVTEAWRTTCSKLVVASVLLLGAVGAFSAPAPHEGKTADEVAKELANPNNDLAKLTFKNQYRWYKGDLPDANEQSNYTLLFQPIFPFSLGPTASGGKSVLFLRPAIPLLVDQPVPGMEGGQFDWDEKTAMGDWGFDLSYGVTEKSGFLWLGGINGTLPTASDSDVAGKQWRLGPELVLAKITKVGVFGIFPSHQWDVAGWGDGKDYDYSTTQIQPLIIFKPGGWQIAAKGLYDYDWEGEEWTVPLNLSVARTVKLNGRPWQFEVEVNYYVEQPDAFGPEWMVGIKITPVVSNFIENMFKGK